MQEWESSVVEQGTHKWIPIDIATGKNNIVGLTWNGTELTEADVEDAASYNLPVGHIIYWAKADVLAETPYTITISDGEDETVFTVSFDEV